jgi:8-oxo-dGTP pyrophosphatase MutT (NUDIX family)
VITVERVSEKLIVECAAVRKTFAPDVEAAIDAEWVKAQAANPRLFNGEVMTLDHVEKDASGLITKLMGGFIDYRTMLASRFRPEIFQGELPMALGITGAAFCNEGLICGQRAMNSGLGGGGWEVAPAGTIDRAAVTHGRIDLAALVLRELEEEIGVSLGSVVGTPVPYAFALRTDDTAPHAEIGMKVTLRLSAAEVLAAFEVNPHREHSALRILPTAEAHLFEEKFTPALMESAALARALKTFGIIAAVN